MRDAVRGAAEGTRGVFAKAPVAIDETLGAVFGRAARTSESARPETSSSHTESTSVKSDFKVHQQFIV